MKQFPQILAIILIVIMITLAVVSLRQESATMDEVAHIPAGYSYLSQKDYRLNPEHPPLLKDLSAIPLVFIEEIKFPHHLYSWTTKVNGQWDFGFNFLYNSDNDADKIIFWSRLPMLLLLIALGFFIYRWTKELYGKWPALLATFFFAFSPTFIAHGRYVTTDVGAAVAFFIATYYFIKWIKKPENSSLILAGIFFGLAQLIKFSLFLLVPYFGLLLLIWIIINKKRFWKYIWKFILILIIGYILVYPIYLFHVFGYPHQKQISDTDFIASHFPFKAIHKPLVWMANQPVLRPYAHYFLGLFMVFQRATGGNTTYFLGEVTNKGWHSYFPIVYAIKTPLVLHILTIIALLFLAWQIKKPFWKKLFSRILQSLKNHFPEWAMLIFLIVYWGFTLKSNLNIGVRHILPTFPFVYILVSGQVKRIFSFLKGKKFSGIWVLAFGFLILWYMLSSLSIFPYYLTHFNELVGGSKNGYIYVTDSNLDWGQDLKRLKKWIDKYNTCALTRSPEACMNYTVPIKYNESIEKIKVDYFGGATAEYYLKDKYEEWHGDWNPADAKGSWLAVSATFLQQGRAIATKGFDKPTDYYMWLNQYEPVTVIGNSIFVYYIE